MYHSSSYYGSTSFINYIKQLRNEYIEAIVQGGIKIVETAGRSPEKYMEQLKAADIKVIHKCTSVRHSLKAEKIGCDAVSVDGFECGGHPGEDDMPNMILLPRAAEELKIPFVASGGMYHPSASCRCFQILNNF